MCACFNELEGQSNKGQFRASRHGVADRRASAGYRRVSRTGRRNAQNVYSPLLEPRKSGTIPASTDRHDVPMMTRPRLYVARLLPDEVMRLVRQEFGLTAEPRSEPPDPLTLLDGLREADAAICTLTERIGAEVLAQAPRLRVIANYAVGYDNIDVPAAQARGLIVTNTPEVLTDATADLTWALLLAVARRLTEGDRLVRQGAWTGWAPTQLLGAEVHGKTLGIVGMGRIGQAVARRAAGFAMRVLYASRRDVPAGAGGGTWQRRPLQDLLTESDFVSLHVPLTPETRHLIGTRELQRMKPTAYLINTARGPVVDETALADALASGRIAGAGLDVYEQEPRVHPGLLALPQVVALPHLGSATHHARIRMGLMCVENVRAVLAGRPALNPVT